MDPTAPAPVTFLAALLVGFLGSTHCIGMCGGIAGTLAVSTGPRASLAGRSAYLLLYNLGRITSYGVAGGFAAAVGGIGLGLFPAAGGQAVARWISIVFLVALGAYLAGWWSFLPTLERFGARLWRRIEPLGRRLLPVSNVAQAFGFGLVWGWLPCGLVYSVLAWAAVTGDPRHGALLMLGFGLGTLPTVLCLGAAGDVLNRLRRHPWVRQMAGISLLLFAAALFAMQHHPAVVGEHGGTHTATHPPE